MRNHYLLTVWLLPLLLFFHCSDRRRFADVTLAPGFEVNGRGENIDSIAFWEAPDPSNSLMFVTAKENSLVEVWKFPFEDGEQDPLVHATFARSPVNGVCVDQDENLLYVSIGRPSSTVSVFDLPGLNYMMSMNKSGVDLKSEPNLAMLALESGEKRIYISADDVVYIHDAATGKYQDAFIPPHECEAMAADPYYQALYIPDENDRTGVYVYHPDGSAFMKNQENRFENHSIFQEDGEGIVIYVFMENGEDAGEGLIVVADQREKLTDFEVFDRRTWIHLGAFKIEGVSNTDGIASTQQPMPDYPLGLFAALNDDSSVACVGWDRILRAIGR